MKNIKNDYEKWLFIIPFAISWLAIIQFSDIANVVSFETLKKIPDAVAVASIFYFLFSRYMWRWPAFKGWLVPYPNLQGTWIGFLHSTWENPETKKRVEPIPIQVCIKQDFESLHISMFTKESESFSQAAKFITENDGSIGLKYTYTNKPKATVRERSEIHEGAASLKVVVTPKLSLSGDYWTGRKTTGEIEVTKKLDKPSDCYREDLE